MQFYFPTENSFLKIQLVTPCKQHVITVNIMLATSLIYGWK